MPLWSSGITYSKHTFENDPTDTYAVYNQQLWISTHDDNTNQLPSNASIHWIAVGPKLSEYVPVEELRFLYNNFIGDYAIILSTISDTQEFPTFNNLDNKKNILIEKGYNNIFDVNNMDGVKIYSFFNNNFIHTTEFSRNQIFGDSFAHNIIDVNGGVNSSFINNIIYKTFDSNVLQNAYIDGNKIFDMQGCGFASKTAFSSCECKFMSSIETFIYIYYTTILEADSLCFGFDSTVVSEEYEKTIYKRPDGTYRLSYMNDADTLTVVDPIS